MKSLIDVESQHFSKSNVMKSKRKRLLNNLKSRATKFVVLIGRSLIRAFWFAVFLKIMFLIFKISITINL